MMSVRHQPSRDNDQGSLGFRPNTYKEATMAFIQTITIVTDDIDEVEAQLVEWIAATAGQHTAQRVTLTADHDHPKTYVQIVEFPTSEAAMVNSRLPETHALAGRLARLCTAPPVFQNLDVRHVDELAAKGTHGFE
jgi:hypothetical protein